MDGLVDARNLVVEEVRDEPLLLTSRRPDRRPQHRRRLDALVTARCGANLAVKTLSDPFGSKRVRKEPTVDIRSRLQDNELG
ncbi:hypothetical protein [Cellulomonas soli]